MHADLVETILGYEKADASRCWGLVLRMRSLSKTVSCESGAREKPNFLLLWLFPDVVYVYNMHLLYALWGKTMNHTSISDFRSKIGDYLGHLGSAPVVLERHGKPTAVVLSYAEYQRLQDLEDAWWGERAQAALESGLVGHEETMQHLKEKLDAAS